MSTVRTLFVEDDPAQARLIRERMRETEDIELTCCESLAEALTAIRAGGTHAFDVVLLDLGLPDSEGIDTIRSVFAAAPRLPIVVFSGRRDLDTAIAAMQHGAQDYILKSAGDAENLTRALRLAIVRKRLQDVEQMLVAVVSHDLRAPLQTIVLASDVMLAEPRPSRHAASVRRAAVRATALVNDLLDATRARLAGVLPVEIGVADVAAITTSIVDELRSANPNRTIDVTVDGHTPIRVDGRRFSQVVQNLVGNALQHSPSSSIVQVGLRHRDHHVELAVHNTGARIPDHIRAHLFEPLERPSREQDPSHSVGLGLYIVSEIVRAHDGSIEVDSTDQGTAFRVRFPTG